MGDISCCICVVLQAYKHTILRHLLFRYRISGSSLLAAMDQSTQLPSTDVTSAQPNKSDQTDGQQEDVNRGMQEDISDSSLLQGNEVSRVDDRNGRGHTTVDIAEVLRRWTHALQRIHKQSLLLVCLIQYSVFTFHRGHHLMFVSIIFGD